MGLTHPVTEVSHVVRALRLEVCGVGLGDAIDSGSAAESVDIHVEGHQVSSSGSRQSGQARA